MQHVTTSLLATIGLLALAMPGQAQGPGPANGGVYAPFVGPVNPNLRTGPPLNPYLNLFIGRSLGINYLQAVRPAIQANLNAPQSAPSATFGPRGTFFPPPGGDLDAQLAERGPAPERGFSPTGHPAGFSNTLGFFGGAGPTAQPANQPPQAPMGRR